MGESPVVQTCSTLLDKGPQGKGLDLEGAKVASSPRSPAGSMPWAPRGTWGNVGMALVSTSPAWLTRQRSAEALRAHEKIQD